MRLQRGRVYRFGCGMVVKVLQETDGREICDVQVLKEVFVHGSILRVGEKLSIFVDRRERDQGKFGVCKELVP